MVEMVTEIKVLRVWLHSTTPDCSWHSSRAGKRVTLSFFFDQFQRHPPAINQTMSTQQLQIPVVTEVCLKILYTRSKLTDAA
jgi:hypothetical protein